MVLVRFRACFFLLNFWVLVLPEVPSDFAGFH